jgi:RNA polymerase sigma factor (sigma-70 family)
VDQFDDVDLWRRARAGDGRSFAAVFRLHRDAVTRQALRFLADPADAEEAAAAAFFELWRRRDSVRVVDGSVLPWLLVTAANLARNGLRAARRREALLNKIIEEHDRDVVARVDEVDVGIDRLEFVDALRRLPRSEATLLTMVALRATSRAKPPQLSGSAIALLALVCIARSRSCARY